MKTKRGKKFTEWRKKALVEEVLFGPWHMVLLLLFVFFFIIKINRNSGDYFFHNKTENCIRLKIFVCVFSSLYFWNETETFRNSCGVDLVTVRCMFALAKCNHRRHQSFLRRCITWMCTSFSLHFNESADRARVRERERHLVRQTNMANSIGRREKSCERKTSEKPTERNRQPTYKFRIEIGTHGTGAGADVIYSIEWHAILL